MKLNRRSFVGSSVSGIAATGMSLGRSSVGPNDRIRVAGIGNGGMGRYDLSDFQLMPEIEIVAVCDVWEHNRDVTAAMLKNNPDKYADFRRVLDRKDIDVVVVATPDHWHAPILIAACEAGKDVYVEKPLSHTLREGRKMVEAAHRNNRIVQMGTQQRSGAHYKEAVELVRAGKLGKVSRVHAWNYENLSPKGFGRFGQQPVPEGLDWDMYLGPAPMVPFQPNRFIYNFRWYWDYSGGKATDWGTHHFDIVQWAMDVKAPRSAFAVGHKFVIQDETETPDTLEIVFEYDDFILTYSHSDCQAQAPYNSSHGIEFRGSDGILFLNRSGYQIMPETMGTYEVERPPYAREIYKENHPLAPWEDGDRERRTRANYVVGAGSNQHVAHIRNFVDCVKSRQQPISDIETGHYSTSVPHLANIALKTGRKIEWDWKNERIIGDSEASKLLTKSYRGPWKV